MITDIVQVPQPSVYVEILVQQALAHNNAVFERGLLTVIQATLHSWKVLPMSVCTPTTKAFYQKPRHRKVLKIYPSKACIVASI